MSDNPTSNVMTPFKDYIDQWGNHFSRQIDELRYEIAQLKDEYKTLENEANTLRKKALERSERRRDADWLQRWIDRLGDGPGLGGFHTVIRNCIFEYANRVLEGDVQQNDATLTAILSKKILKAPRRPERTEQSLRARYACENWLQKEINDTFNMIKHYHTLKNRRFLTCILTNLKTR